MQALLGVISPNFRMVALEFAEPVWQLLFVLESESAVDREEIEDAVGDFDGLLLGLSNTGIVKYNVNVVVNAEPLPMLDHSSWRIVFRRRDPA